MVLENFVQEKFVPGDSFVLLFLQTPADKVFGGLLERGDKFVVLIFDILDKLVLGAGSPGSGAV